MSKIRVAVLPLVLLGAAVCVLPASAANKRGRPKSTNQSGISTSDIFKKDSIDLEKLKIVGGKKTPLELVNQWFPGNRLSKLKHTVNTTGVVNIGIAVRRIRDALSGGNPFDRVDNWAVIGQVNVAMLRDPKNNQNFKLLESAGNKEIDDALKQNGTFATPYDVVLGVEDIHKAQSKLDLEFSFGPLRRGAFDRPMLFIDPKEYGVRAQLVEVSP